MAVLNWKHHTLIQALMSRGPLKEDEFKKIFVGVTGKNLASCQNELGDYLLKINKELSYVQMELRCCRNQNDGQVCYGLVNNVSDEQSKLGTKYSVQQLAFFKGILEAIVQDVTAQGRISTVDALNIRLESQVQTGRESQSQVGLSQVPSALRNFSMSQKEKTIEELAHDNWLCRTPDGDIGLGIRSYLDLRSWLHSCGIPACEVCNEAAVKAKACPNDGCSFRIHHYCLKKKFSRRTDGIVCPICGLQWESQVPKAENIEEEDEDQQIDNTQIQLPSGSRRKRLRVSKNVDADTDSQNSGSASGLRRVTRASTRMR